MDEAKFSHLLSNPHMAIFLRLLVYILASCSSCPKIGSRLQYMASINGGGNSLLLVGSNLRNRMLLRRDFIDLHFGGVMVMDLPSQIVGMVQTEHSTVGGNPDGQAQEKNYTDRPFPPFSPKINK